MLLFYIFSAVILFCAFCYYFHLRFKLAVSINVLDLKGTFCITFFKLKTICFDFAIEKSFFVLYNRKGVPVYYPINWPEKNPAEFKTRLYFPVAEKMRFKSLCMTTEMGVSGNAAATAMSLSVIRLVYDIVFSLMSNKNSGMKLCRDIKPVYDKNCIKTELSSIFIISLANIIIYAAVTVIKSFRRKAAISRKENAMHEKVS